MITRAQGATSLTAASGDLIGMGAGATLGVSGVANLASNGTINISGLVSMASAGAVSMAGAQNIASNGTVNVSGLVAIATGGVLKVSGIIAGTAGTQLSAIASASSAALSTAYNQTQIEGSLNALRTKLNSALAALETVGIIAT